jgi:4-hydroxy-tetrahydrodipicolinate synthase
MDIMTDRALEGVFPILLTTFHEDGSLDLESQRRLIHHLLEQGAHGLGLFGNASEGYTLSAGERRQLLTLIAHEVNGDIPLVASSGHTGTDVAVELSRESEDLGADALMVLPPYYLKTDGDGLVHYYAEIADAVKIPVMVQDAPALTTVAMPPSLLARMAREIPGVRYVKVEAAPTSPKFSAVAREAGGKLVLFGGLNGNFYLEELARGSRGLMPGSDMIDLYVRVWDAWHDGRRDEAWDIFTQMLPLVRFELQPGLGVSAMKHNLKAAGIIKSARVRHPTSNLDREALAELEFLRQRLRSSALDDRVSPSVEALS